MLSQNPSSAQVQFTKSLYGVIACDYYLGVLYLAQPMKCIDDDAKLYGWRVVVPNVPRKVAIRLRDELRDLACGEQYTGAL